MAVFLGFCGFWMVLDDVFRCFWGSNVCFFRCLRCWGG